MRGYGQFCPVAKGAEIFAERWTPLVLRELLCGSSHFGDLHRGVPLMSRSLLSLRLKQLEEAGVLRRKQGQHGPEYHLTRAGREFAPIIQNLGEWGHRWFDLKRTARADAVLSPIKGNFWQPTDVLFPIPDLELNRNPLLIQNPGY